jgi:hypothetical protein
MVKKHWKTGQIRLVFEWDSKTDQSTTGRKLTIRKPDSFSFWMLTVVWFLMAIQKPDRIVCLGPFYSYKPTL